MRRQPSSSEQLRGAIKSRLADGPPPSRSRVTPTEQLAIARKRHDLAGAIKATLAAADEARGPARAAVWRAAKRQALESWFNGLTPEQQQAATDPGWITEHGGVNADLLAEVIEAGADAGLALTEAQLRAALADFSEDENDWSSPYHPANVDDDNSPENYFSGDDGDDADESWAE